VTDLPKIPADDPTLGLFQIVREDGSADPAADPFLDDATLLGMYRGMLLIRLLDERMLMRQRQGKVGFFGTITGQEATPIATAFATDKRDWIFPALRESAIMLARGFPLDLWLAQVYGNERDLLKGRQMPSHMSGRAVNQVSWSSNIGTQIPQAVGAALAARAAKSDAVMIGFMGDGATSEPDFHAAMTFAARMKPAVVFVCQNNHWSISVPTEKQTASKTIAVKAHAYGMAGARVDGNDVLAVYTTLKRMVERARRGEGPAFVECVTYRIGPHSSSDDPTRYRSDEEVERWRKRDPIERFEKYLRKSEILDEAAIAREREEINRGILESIRSVEELGPPARASLFDDVFARRPGHLDEQAAELESGPVAAKH
jgi:pyruvate dehydrogenase E1 component alpha subunit